MVLKQMSLMAHPQGTVKAFGDVFPPLAVLFIVFAALVLVMRHPPEQVQPISDP